MNAQEAKALAIAGMERNFENLFANIESNAKIGNTSITTQLTLNRVQQLMGKGYKITKATFPDGTEMYRVSWD